MYRDFSENSKQKLLGFVSEVENEKICDFTDWVGDRWYDFESWIGMLNIKHYLNDVNKYHKKVIDKNNATKTSINNIFNGVRNVDIRHKNNLIQIENSLEQWKRYIEEMKAIVTPSNGKFNGQYIAGRLNNILNDILAGNYDIIKKCLNKDFADWTDMEKDLLKQLLSKAESERTKEENDLLNEIYSDEEKTLKVLILLTGEPETSNVNVASDILSKLSKVVKEIGKKAKDDEMSLSGSVLGYLGTLVKLIEDKPEGNSDVISSMFSLFSGSTAMWGALFNFYENILSPYEASKLFDRFGKTNNILAVLGSIAEFGEEGVDTYNIFTDKNSSIWDKFAQILDLGDAGINVGGKVYIGKLLSTKTLQFIGNSNNQILATEMPTLKFTTSAEVTKQIKNVGGWLAFADSLISTFSSGFKQYGKVSSDGNVDMTDVGSIGVHGSLAGLDPIVSFFSAGIIHYDSEKFADDLENRADNFIRGDSGLAQYIRDENNNSILRFGASMISGVYVIGDKVVSDVSNVAMSTAETVADWCTPKPVKAYKEAYQEWQKVNNISIDNKSMFIMNS